MNISTTISLARELSINVGEFTQPPLVAGTRLYDMCQLGALHKHADNAPLPTASVATHTYVCAHAHPFTSQHRLIDTRDQAKYTVQVIHSAAAVLSMILVYGKDQRLLAMAHLIAADCLPSKEQLDHNLVCKHMMSYQLRMCSAIPAALVVA